MKLTYYSQHQDELQVLDSLFLESKVPRALIREKPGQSWLCNIQKTLEKRSFIGEHHSCLSTGPLRMFALLPSALYIGGECLIIKRGSPRIQLLCNSLSASLWCSKEMKQSAPVQGCTLRPACCQFVSQTWQKGTTPACASRSWPVQTAFWGPAAGLCWPLASTHLWGRKGKACKHAKCLTSPRWLLNTIQSKELLKQLPLKIVHRLEVILTIPTERPSPFLGSIHYER